jgi:hypothetical protein
VADPATSARRRAIGAPRRDEPHHHLCLIRAETGARREVARLVPPPRAEQRAHPLCPQPVELVDRAQDDPAFPGEACGVCRIEDARHLHHAVEDLAVVDAHDIVPARDSCGLEAVRQHRADLGIGGDGGRAHGIRIALVELAEPPRAGLLVAPDRPHGVAAIGARQVGAVLRIDPGERRRQVVAQREPVLILVLPGEDALVGALHVGQELAQRLERLHRARLQRVEAVGMVDAGNPVQHRGAFGDFRPEVVAESLRRLGPRPSRRPVPGHACPRFLVPVHVLGLPLPRAPPEGNARHACHADRPGYAGPRTAARCRPAPGGAP